MIFVDSSVWVDYFNGTRSAATDCLDSVLGKEPVGLGDVVLLYSEKDFESFHQHLKLDNAMEFVNLAQ